MRELRAERAALEQQLEESTARRVVDREARLAALNLMEDALAARNAERREIEERRRVELELIDRDRREDEFLATLAHELRNPLAPVLFAATLLRSEPTDLATSRRLHAMIERQVDHMARLVDDSTGRLPHHAGRDPAPHRGRRSRVGRPGGGGGRPVPD